MTMRLLLGLLLRPRQWLLLIQPLLLPPRDAHRRRRPRRRRERVRRDLEQHRLGVERDEGVLVRHGGGDDDGFGRDLGGGSAASAAAAAAAAADASSAAVAVADAPAATPTPGRIARFGKKLDEERVNKVRGRGQLPLCSRSRRQ